MLISVQVLVCVTFSFFVLFDCASVVAKHAGYYSQYNAIGYTMSYVSTVVSRLFAFVYPPLLGFIVISQKINLLLYTALASLLAAGICVIILIIFYRTIFYTYLGLIVTFQKSGSIFGSILTLMTKTKINDLKETYNFPVIPGRNIRKKPFIVSSLIVSAYAVPAFSLNMIAMNYMDSAPIILQSSGMITGIGTILMAFILEPLISFSIENGSRVNETIFSLLYGRILCYLVLSPLILLILNYYISI